MRSKSGFTIVELLIVIVVIGILAAITVVSFNGIKRNAQVSGAKAELNSLRKAAGMFYVEQGRYPTLNAEWNTVFRNANMYNNTRVSATKSFTICSHPATSGATYSIIAITPISLVDTAGQNFYYTSQNGDGTFTWNTSITGTFSAERVCKHTPNGFDVAAWSYDL